MKCLVAAHSAKYLFIAGLFFCLSQDINAQNSLGLRFTPNVIGAPRVVNPSAGSVFGEKRLSFDAGIDFQHMFNKSWGINAGVDLGVIDWNIYLNAPDDAFGVGTGSGSLIYNENIENFMYNALSTQLIFTFNLRRSKVVSYFGPALRYYHQEKEHTIVGAAFNRLKPYNPDDPNAGPPDLLIDIPPVGDRLHLNISTGIGIERQVSRQSSLIFGIRKNWGLQPLGNGSLLVQMYDELNYGSFSPRSDYIGLDIKFNYTLSKTTGGPLPAAGDVVTSRKYRKSIFAEALGSGLLASGNFDMRLNKNRNDGIGFRAGLGLGAFYKSVQVKDRSAEKRYITFPVMANHIIGMGKSGLETAIGFTPQIAFSQVTGDERAFIPHGTINVGYRLQPIKDGLIIRATWTPLFDHEGLYPAWAGLSIGYSFR
jgi:hypothetical protein